MAFAFPPLFQEQVLLLVAKRTMLREFTSDITTLVVGSSHGDFGFDPSLVPGSFNLCSRSQDLKHSYYLYSKLSEQNLNLSTLVIFYSIFSPGWLLESSPSEGEIAVAINELFNLGLEYESHQLASLNAAVAGKLGEMSVHLPGGAGFLPDHGKGFMPATVTAEKRAADHMRFNTRRDAVPYLDMMIDLASRNGHEVVIVIPPARRDFRLQVGKGQELFDTLLRYTERDREVQILDFYNRDDFDDAFFGDFDHLVPTGEGTGLLSRSVAEALKPSRALGRLAV
ncbi:hypothetical protein [Rhizobium leguminosarum]|uniref:hypothetical protein n=1 Tax=Rhizobium leguminosarum TaxID=384 RepID=UPI001C97A518|nr:hypothetical protein [Rhizobium leguminosarum]MBY5404559.1 hypothetical protein [Rhizobium leguminosarum]